MKKLLMFLVLLLINIGAKAEPVDIKWPANANPERIKIHYDDAGNQEIEIKGDPGSFAEFMELVNSTDDTDEDANAAKALFNSWSTNATKLKLKGNWNDADFNALKSSSVTPLASVTTLDMSDNNFSVTAPSDISGMALSSLEIVRFSDDFVVESEPEYGEDGKMTDAITFTADDAIKNLSTTNNPNLKLAYASYKGGTAPNDYNKFAVHSFEANAFSQFMAERNNPNIPEYYQLCQEIRKSKYVGMSGVFGDKDFTNNELHGLIFSDNTVGKPAVWDFTDATFVTCENVPSGVPNAYSGIDDCFEEFPKSAPGNVTTNAFFYFNGYATTVASIKLPTGIDELPPLCLEKLASENLANYKLVTGKSDAQIQATYPDLSANNQTMKFVPITTLVIPNNINFIGHEAVKWGHLYTVEIGSGIEEIRGGAFLKCEQLQALEFKSGIEGECKIGEYCFSDCQNMAHIELCEGIVSIGAGCFEVSHYMESIRLPETLKKIGNRAFMNCHALNSIIIPPNVDQIGKQAFHNTGLKDIYLTNPNRVPVIFSFGSGGQDTYSTFYDSEVWAWNGIPDANAPQSHPDFTQMTWEEAADWYYMNANRLAALHYPPTLKDILHADISRTYHLWSSEHDGLPAQQDLANRLGVEGATNADGSGKWTTAGWAQFLLMRESKPENVFEKKYEDVWYTMCFPFDLTDEQLASAFNETFNIVDFSGVEIKPVTGTNTKQLILHFNNVAETFYKDTEGKLYQRKRDGNGNIIREKPSDNDFEYNVYLDDEDFEYHHVTVGINGKSYKTKTFKKYVNGQPTGDVLYIDGYLAIAGHPYMIHPSTGAKTGSPANCRFRGITFMPVDNPETAVVENNYDWLYEKEARTVDLGVAKTTDNFNQAAYEGYAGQTYTFIGTWRAYDETKADPEPTIENGGLDPLPDVNTYIAEYPEPSMDDLPQSYMDIYNQYGPRVTSAPQPEVQDPATNTSKYSNEFIVLYNTTRCVDWDNTTPISTYGEDLISCEPSDFYQINNGVCVLGNQSQNHGHHACINRDLIAAYLGGGLVNDQYQFTDKSKFTDLQTLAKQYASDLAAYDQYRREADAYTAWNNYYTNYLPAHTEENTAVTAYDNALSSYQEAMGRWRQACTRVNQDNAATYATWMASLADYPVQIPKYAYFLAREGVKLPKYYREMADEGPARTGGVWSQYSAIIKPNQGAIDGIEQGVESTTSSGNVKGFDMVFNEDFVGDYDPTEIKEIVAEAEKKGQKVEYFDVVVSINGEVVRQGTSLQGLPSGMYIINGKKYLVK